MKLSKRDQNLLLFLVGFGVLAIVWFIVVSPMREKTESLRMENSSLKGTAELYQSINMNKDEYEKTLEVMDEILGIKEIINKPVRQMSLGQRVKGDLVAAMLHSPEVLFLDEPTIGLDVNTKFALRKFIKEINSVNKTTIVLTTHDLGDIEELCERLIIINHGKIIEDGNLSDIIDRIAPYKTLVVQYYDDVNIPSHEKCTLDKVEGNVARYRFMKNDITAAALIAALSEKKKMKDVAIEEVGIDEIIRIAYGQ